MLYEFKMGYNTAKATKDICCVKDNGTVDNNTISRWFEKFCSGGMDFDNQAKLGRSKTVDFETILKALEANSWVALENIR